MSLEIYFIQIRTNNKSYLMRLPQSYRCFLAHNASPFVTDVDVTLIPNSRVCVDDYRSHGALGFLMEKPSLGSSTRSIINELGISINVNGQCSREESTF